MDFTAFDILPAAELDKMVANIESLADGTGFDAGGLSDGAGIWWEQIGKSTLGVAGDTLTISGIPARKYLKFIVMMIGSGSINTNVRFNNDAAANYAGSVFYNNAGSPGMYDYTSQNQIYVDATAVNGVSYSEWTITNTSAKSKAIICELVQDNGAASVRPLPQFGTHKWVSNAQISRVDLFNLSSGDFAVGSEIIVLGHN